MAARRPELEVTNTGTYSVQLSLDGCTTSDAIDVDFLAVIDQVDLRPRSPVVRRR